MFVCEALAVHQICAMNSVIGWTNDLNETSSSGITASSFAPDVSKPTVQALQLVSEPLY